METTTRNPLRRRRLHAVAGILFGLAAGAAAADPADAGWRIRPEFHLAGITDYRESGGSQASRGIAAATLEFTLHSARRPYWGGPFLDYRVSADGGFDDQRNAGVYFRYNLPRWDATTWLFVNRSPGNPHTWLYAARLRYRLAGDHKIGMEAMAPLEDPGSPMLMGGYYGSASDRLSVKLLAGAAVGGAVDFAARLDLVWHVF
ncbi:MAG: hypothetical protein OEW35_18970 [Gammaproteobacteria bacterium]|nr:hypothetical protein [Gammaproteobacteria bacterium]MDH4255704.1 hypothetical protein [Gammaproteobacteria bacterium]MDH5310725.1 hypothetical protein [Gammaproteobacteria bacterium]